MNDNRRFQKGSGVYTCASCGHRTRNTGDQSVGSDLCPYCSQMIELANALSDGSISEETFEREGAALKEKYDRD